ncbi:MAG TPA: nucleotidyltransferase family protein [Bryobacteraceae bacterium]|nr:nucleotidyltransferase family protein [Bryobacteraceae bacterium]
MTSSEPNPEFEFLCGCVRRFVHPLSPLPNPSQLDWAALIELAREHLVLPLLTRALNGSQAAPADVLIRLRESFKDSARSNLALSSELIRLLEAFQSAGVPVVPLKGPTLAEHLYGDVTLRSFSDLDLLIQRADVLRVKSLLESRGYRLTSPLHWNSESAVLRARDSQLTFSEPERRIAIDVHWRLLPEYYPAALETQHVWRDLRTIAFAGRQIPALRPEQLLLFLAAHGAKHHWERLGWICDVACLIRAETNAETNAEPNMDWDLPFREAEHSATSRMLALSLLLANRVAGAVLPAEVARRIEQHPAADSLAAAIRTRIASKTPGTSTTLDAARFAWQLYDRPTTALAAIAGIFFLPTEAEYRALQLPTPLFGLYYPFRLLRLGTKYTAQALGFGRSG